MNLQDLAVEYLLVIRLIADQTSNCAIRKHHQIDTYRACRHTANAIIEESLLPFPPEDYR